VEAPSWGKSTIAIDIRKEEDCIPEQALVRKGNCRSFANLPQEEKEKENGKDKWQKMKRQSRQESTTRLAGK
jgi:hypothetical protein